MLAVFHWAPSAHLAFIYPSGLVVNGIHGGGEFIDGEWFFFLGRTEFILGESCSGSAFFTVVLFYVGYGLWVDSKRSRRQPGNQTGSGRLVRVSKPMTRFMIHSTVMFGALYLFVIAVNGFRVWTSMLVHTALLDSGHGVFRDEVHTLVGAVVFSLGFLAVFLWINKREARIQDA